MTRKRMLLTIVITAFATAIATLLTVWFIISVQARYELESDMAVKRGKIPTEWESVGTIDMQLSMSYNEEEGYAERKGVLEGVEVYFYLDGFETGSLEVYRKSDDFLLFTGEYNLHENTYLEFYILRQYTSFSEEFDHQDINCIGFLRSEDVAVIKNDNTSLSSEPTT